MNKIIKLTEDDIHSMIKECISNILKEMLDGLIKEKPMMWKLSDDGKNVLFNKRINIFKKA